MSITPYLHGQHFDPATKRVLGLALELVCIALRTGDCDDHVKQAIANKLIALAEAGERTGIDAERSLDALEIGRLRSSSRSRTGLNRKINSLFSVL